MYDLRQFRPVLYVVLLLGLLGYAIALESPEHFVLGGLFTAGHFWMTRDGRTVKIPRLLASTLALITGLWSAAALLRGYMMPLMAISQWLFVLLLVTMWSRQDNRAFGQMLIMSLVLMVAGAINTASLVYGLLLIAYLFLSLYCCLLFHLKVESEYAQRTYAQPQDTPPPGAATRERLAFNRSMRRLSTFVSLIAILFGVGCFLFFPRSQNPGLLMQMQHSSAAMTGFSEQMGFQQISRIAQNPEVVAHVQITRNDKPLQLDALYLRGLTLDIYTGSFGRREAMKWQWFRSPWMGDRAVVFQSRAGQTMQFVARPGPDSIRQSVLLQPASTNTLFAMDGLCSLKLERDAEVTFTPADGTVRLRKVPQAPLRYEAISTGTTLLGPSMPPDPSPDTERASAAGIPAVSVIDPRVSEYARRPEVCGRDDKGVLADQRGNAGGPDPLDETIARNIERHFHETFAYTLDLTDVRQTAGEEPIVAFLYDFKRGHCEYFAGAMTLMCQSLGMQARVVIGFRAGPEDYSTWGSYYIVRQSHAHAWVEVLTPSGWMRFDPTSGRAPSTLASSGPLRTIREFLDLLQYKWASSVVSYNYASRVSVIGTIDQGIAATRSAAKDFMAQLRGFLGSEGGYTLSSRLILGAIILALGVLLLAITIFVLEKRRLYRRADRMGLGALPADARLRLARQLAFYDGLIKLLQRHQISRPAHLTPQEFATSLDFLPGEAYEQINRLTRVFYRVRYGQHPLAHAQRRHLQTVVQRLARTITAHRKTRLAHP